MEGVSKVLTLTQFLILFNYDQIQLLNTARANKGIWTKYFAVFPNPLWNICRSSYNPDMGKNNGGGIRWDLGRMRGTNANRYAQ